MKLKSKEKEEDNETTKLQESYIPPEKTQQTIDHLRLF